ncbi:MAG: hypothetical protein UT89_C0006G0013 [Parcubacteria group bacterium GW2011_GWE1_40_20]|nr:MAG: hypothetical protein UT89_C0006G0013 [Parcubacteria group bacterium GW2011_GWE1_40_20]
MKKLLIIAGVLLFMGIGVFITSKEDKQTVNNTIQNSQPEMFTKEKALKRVQDYKIQIDLQSPTIVKGSTLFEVYEIRGKIPAIKNLGWNVTEDDSNKFIVSFKEETNLGVNEPKWEVDENSIRAVNGTALKFTPELGGTQKDMSGTESEKQVYETFSSLYKKYSDTEELDRAEQKALSETAQKYQITIEQVREIFTRLDKAKYNL